jgi:Flp pilus assembly protein TadG
MRQYSFTTQPDRRGFIMVTMALAAVGTIGALGIAVDLGRMYVAKSETQSFCDSAAYSATLNLDGTSDGISAAKAAVASAANYWNFDSLKITDYEVVFAKLKTGPWVANPSPASGYVYTRVTANVPLGLYFIPVVVAQKTQNVQALAVAGQIPQGTLKRGLGPFTAVSTDESSANFGFQVGKYYNIQWPAYNGTKAGCGPGNPDKCFVQPPCDGDPQASKSAIVEHWGASVNGYWGSNANHEIYQAVIDVIQLQPVSIGDTIAMTSGNKNMEALALDDRVNQDGDRINNEPSNYLENPYHNGRRLIGLPVVKPTAAGTIVIGYAAFLLVSNGNPSNYYASGNGNDPFCAVYAGPYVQGGSTSGGGSAGYTVVRLVQ